jgi:hypothetical protein
MPTSAHKKPRLALAAGGSGGEPPRTPELAAALQLIALSRSQLIQKIREELDENAVETEESVSKNQSPPMRLR